MATALKRQILGGAVVHEFLLTNADPTGADIASPGAPDRSVHIFGTFGAATITIQGSNEEVPENWNTLHEATGADLIVTTACLEIVAECCAHMRAILTGGAGSSVKVIFCGGVKP